MRNVPDTFEPAPAVGQRLHSRFNGWLRRLGGGEGSAISRRWTARLGLLALFLLNACELQIRGSRGPAGSDADAAAPGPITGAAWITPAGGGASAYPSGSFQGTIGADSSSTAQGTPVTLKFYLNDPSCGAANLVGATAGSPGSAFTVNTSSLTAGGDGTKALYYTAEDEEGNISACLASGLSYLYQAVPKISFAREGFSYQENGTAVGTPVSIRRDVCGVSSSVTVTTSDVTAASGTNYTAGSTVVSFAAADCSPKTLSATDFGIVDDTVATGDLYFLARLGSITGAAADEAGAQEAQVNVLDSALTAQFQFNQTFYTVKAGVTSATLVVQRRTSVTAVNVDVAFDDGSALAGTDYTGTTQTLSFAIGENEKTVTVPITPRSSNASFVAKLVNAPATAGMRSLSVAKIRILNAATTCNPAGAPFGGGAGTLGSPYLICTLTQLKQVATSLTSVFRLEADIVSDGTLGNLGNFGGSFDGNEFAIYRFSLTNSGSRAGLFGRVYGTGYFKSLNLLHGRVINSGASTGLMLAQAGSITAVPALSHLFASGYVQTDFDQSAIVLGVIQTPGSGVQNISATGLLSHGLLRQSGAGGEVAGVLGYIYANAGATSYSATLSRLYNGASILSTGNNTGGVMGRFQHQQTATLSDWENRGYVTGGVSVGGVLGDASDAASTIVGTATRFRNYGKVQGSSEVGGDVGIFWTGFLSWTVSDFYNEAPVVASNTRAGGLIADAPLAASGQTFTFSTGVNRGSVTAVTYAGGGVGRLSTSGAVSGTAHTVSDITNYGAVTADYGAGGGIGIIFLDHTGGTGNVSLNTFSNQGDVLSNAAIGRTGGVVGDVLTRIEADPQLTFDQLTSSGVVSCPTGYSCGGIIGRMVLHGNQTSSISGSSSSGIVSGGNGDNYGGIVGYLQLASGNPVLTLSDSRSVNWVQSTTSAIGRVGGLIGYLQNSAGNFTLQDSYSSSLVSVNVDSAGGLIGEVLIDSSATATSIQRSYSTASVTGNQFVGGLVGRLIMGTAAANLGISDSYATGDVTASAYGAGLIGQLHDASPGYCTADLARNYTLSQIAVSGGGAGGLHGLSPNCIVTVTASYWIKDASYNTTIAGDAYDRVYGDLNHLVGQTEPTFVGWDFSGTGAWNAFVEGNFPTLR